MKRWKNEPGVGKNKSGNQGPAGPTGPAGRDGVDGAPGRDGRDGLDGKSAYQIAVDGGFAGTEAEWIASLKGADGQDGRDGADGIDANSRQTDVQSGVTNASGLIRVRSSIPDDASCQRNHGPRFDARVSSHHFSYT